MAFHFGLSLAFHCLSLCVHCLSTALQCVGGDTYTPSSGIWQTVWLEEAPVSYIKAIKIDQSSETMVSVTVMAGGGAAGAVAMTVVDAGGKSVATGSGTAGEQVAITSSKKHPC